MPKRHFQLIDQQLYNKDQSWHYEGIYKYGDHKLRVYIRRNAYDHQSSLKVEVWNPEQLEWKMIRTVPMEKIRSSYEWTYTKQNVPMGPFEEDAQDLLNMAAAILD